MIQELTNDTPFEILMAEEYAKRLNIGRSTLYEWKKNGTLVPGHHYFQSGGVVRYVWSRDLVLDIHVRKSEGPKGESPQPEDEKPQITLPTPPRQKVGINLDY